MSIDRLNLPVQVIFGLDIHSMFKFQNLQTYPLPSEAVWVSSVRRFLPVCVREREPGVECSAGVRRETQPRSEFCRGCAGTMRYLKSPTEGDSASTHFEKRRQLHAFFLHSDSDLIALNILPSCTELCLLNGYTLLEDFIACHISRGHARVVDSCNQRGDVTPPSKRINSL